MESFLDSTSQLVENGMQTYLFYPTET